jgi:hypothetical protein
MFFYFFKPFTIISNFKYLFLNSFSRFNKLMVRVYDFLFFKNSHFFKFHFFLFSSLYQYYNNTDIKKFLFSNFTLYFNFPFFFLRVFGVFDLHSKFILNFLLGNASRFFFRVKKQNFKKFGKVSRKLKRSFFFGNFNSLFSGLKFFYFRYFSINFVNFFVFKLINNFFLNSKFLFFDKNSVTLNSYQFLKKYRSIFFLSFFF